MASELFEEAADGTVHFHETLELTVTDWRRVQCGTRLGATLPLAVVLVGVLILSNGRVTSADADQPPSVAECDAIRVGSHLAVVEVALRKRDTSHLNPDQQMVRAQALDWLNEYRTAGLFSHNHTNADQRVPVSVDAHGTPCAVGYLLIRSGETEVVEEIPRERNFAFVPELADDVRLVQWLDKSGLTLEEAAWIQPAYDHGAFGGSDDSSRYSSGTIGLTLGSAALIAHNALTQPNLDQGEWSGAFRPRYTQRVCKKRWRCILSIV